MAAVANLANIAAADALTCNLMSLAYSGASGICDFDDSICSTFASDWSPYNFSSGELGYSETCGNSYPDSNPIQWLMDEATDFATSSLCDLANEIPSTNDMDFEINVRNAACSG